MAEKPIKVLLVEDNPVDADLVQEFLAEETPGRFAVTHVERLSQALDCLGTAESDVVLLDLSLPDSQGLATLSRVQQEAPEVPIIVLTGADDEALALSAVKAGAQDYLAKGRVDGQLLARSMHYAMDRHRLQAELERTRQREQQQRELGALEQLSGPSQTSVTAQTFGLGSLREGLPDTFNELVRRYEELMDLALERRAYKVEHDVSESLRAVVDQLGFLKAGPRDVVEIHATALKRQTRKATQAKAQAYAEEGRLMVLELMGYLASYYRDYFSGSSRPPTKEASRGGQSQSNKGEPS